MKMNTSVFLLTALLAAATASAHALTETEKPLPSKAVVHHVHAAPVHKKAPRKTTPAMAASRARMKQCGAEWKRDKAAGHTKGTTWPKYWHSCSVRLKAQHA